MARQRRHRLRRPERPARLRRKRRHRRAATDVTVGSALVPSGKLVCVAADQCAVINKWLAKPANAAIVTQLLNPGVATGIAAAIAAVDHRRPHLALPYALLRRLPHASGAGARRAMPLRRRAHGGFAHRRRLPPRPAQGRAGAGRGGRAARFRDVAHANMQVVALESPPVIDEAAWLAALRTGGAGLAGRGRACRRHCRRRHRSRRSATTCSTCRRRPRRARGTAVRVPARGLPVLGDRAAPAVDGAPLPRPMVKDQDCVTARAPRVRRRFVGGSPRGVAGRRQPTDRGRGRDRAAVPRCTCACCRNG